jgi:hypothetical protein
MIILKDYSQCVASPAECNQTTRHGGLQTSFARVAYATQESRIGIDELAYLI